MSLGLQDVKVHRKRNRVYVDTSVVGGCLDKEFAEDSLALFDAFKSGRSVAVVSDITEIELEEAPDAVRDILLSVPSEHVERIEVTEEANSLAEAYLREGVVSRKNLEDARHIAVATLGRVDVLVSWNFKHIVNLGRIHGYNAVNLKLGYPMLEIRTPKEVLDYGNQGG